MLTRPLAVMLTISSALLGQTYSIATVAGGGPLDNIPGTSVGLTLPSVAVDSSGNVFIASGVRVFRLDHATGNISSVAGNGSAAAAICENGPATAVALNNPQGVAVDTSGNLYIADAQGCIRKVSNGVMTTVAGNGSQGFGGDGGPATSAQLFAPVGVAVDSAGNFYIADNHNSRVRKVSNGIITTVAGNGTQGFGGDTGLATSAQLSSPWGLALDLAGNLYIADSGNLRVRKVSSGVITTVAGNGVLGLGGDGGLATDAQLFPPVGVAVDSLGNLYIADNTSSVRKVLNGVITNVAGNGTGGFSGDNGPATSAALFGPRGVAIDAPGNLYIADSVNGRIRRVTSGIITTVAGNGTINGFSGDNGPATGAQLSFPEGVALDSAGALYIADSLNNVVRKVSNGVITTVAGGAANGAQGFAGDNGPATSAQMSEPFAVALDSIGNVYIADQFNHRIRMVSNGMITTVAGTGTPGFGGDNGLATAAQLNSPHGVAADAAGNFYFADSSNRRVRKVANGVITTVAGNGTQGSGGDNGPAIDAQLINPQGVALDSAGDLYITDTGNSLIRKVSNGVITTVSSNACCGIALDSAKNLYIARPSDVLKISNGVPTTVAGTGAAGFSGDGGPATSAKVFFPQGVAVDTSGRVYFADVENNRVRLLTPSGAALPLTITSPLSLSNAVVGVSYGPVPFVATGGSGGYHWSATGLPGGLAIDPNSGALGGTAVLASQGNYDPQFTVTDSGSATAHVNVPLTVNAVVVPAPVITSVSPNPILGISATQTLFINGTGFTNGAAFTIRLTWPGGQTDLQGSMLTFVSSTQLSVAIDFSIAVGAWTVQTINPDLQSSNTFFFSVAAPGATTRMTMPQFTFGGSFYSALYFSNSTNAQQNVRVDFMDNTGAPLTVALVGIGSVSTQTVNLAPGATEVLEALNGTGVSSEGWVEISLPAGVSGYGVFRQVVPGREDQESLVPFAPESSLNSDFTYDETAFNTAVAFVNPTNQTLTLTATAFGKSGAQVGTTQIVLGPRSKSTNTLKTYSGMAGMVGQRGRVVLSVPTGAVSGLALRFGGSEFTNIPVNHH